MTTRHTITCDGLGCTREISEDDQNSHWYRVEQDGIKMWDFCSLFCMHRWLLEQSK